MSRVSIIDNPSRGSGVSNVVSLLFALLVAASSVLILQGCSKAELSDSEYIEKAKDYHDKADLHAAVIELKNALRSNTKNAEAHWLLGRIYVESGDGLAAEKELNKARELGVSDESVLPLLLDALLQQANYPKVLEQDISAIKDERAVSDLLASRGLAYLFLKQPGEAKNEFEKSLNLSAESTKALVGNARLSLLRQDVDTVISNLDKALAINDKYAPAWSVKGDVLQIRKDMEGALAAYSNAIENRYDNGSDLMKRALLYLGMARIEDAQHDIARLKKRFPKHSGVNYAQGVLYFYQKKYPEAQAALELSLESNKDEMQAIYYLGATQFLQGNHEQAKNHLTRYMTAVPGHVPGRKLLTLILLEDKEFAAAEKLIRPVVNAAPEDVFSLNLLASSLLGMGKSDEALELLERIVRIQPDSAAAYTSLSIGLMAEGDKSKSREALKNAITIDPKFHQAEVMLILSYLKDKDFDKAQQAAEDFVKRQSENVVAYNLLGSVYLAAKQETDATKAFEKARLVAPGDAVASSNLAAMALLKGDVKRARQYYNDVLKVTPGHLKTLLKLAELESKQGNRDAMNKVLTVALENNPNAPEPKILLSLDHLQRGKIEQARLLIGGVPDSMRDDPRVLGVLGEVQLASKEFTDAKLTFQRLVEIRPGEAQSHYLLAKAYRSLKENDPYKKELETSLRLAPGHALAKIDLAQLLVTQGKVDVAEGYLSSLKEVESLKGSPAVLELEGRILASLGKSEAALSIYNKLFASYPTTKSLMALVSYKWSLGDKSGATAQLERWSKEHSDDIDVMLALANNYLGMGRDADAIKQYQQVLKSSKDNLIAINNLAWHLRDSDPEQALSLAERAYAAAPESSTVMDTLAMILMKKGNNQKAQRLIERALSKYPDDSTLLYHHALILEKAGGKQAAEKELRKLLKLHKEFSERRDAEAMLKRIGSS